MSTLDYLRSKKSELERELKPLLQLEKELDKQIQNLERELRADKFGVKSGDLFTITPEFLVVNSIKPDELSQFESTDISFDFIGEDQRFYFSAKGFPYVMLAPSDMAMNMRSVYLEKHNANS